MAIDLAKLGKDRQSWLKDRAHSRGTSADLEAFILLDDAISDRMRREALFRRADEVRVRLPGPPLTAEEIEEAINWGR